MGLKIPQGDEEQDTFQTQGELYRVELRLDRELIISLRELSSVDHGERLYPLHVLLCFLQVLYLYLFALFFEPDAKGVFKRVVDDCMSKSVSDDFVTPEGGAFFIEFYEKVKGSGYPRLDGFFHFFIKTVRDGKTDRYVPLPPHYVEALNEGLCTLCQGKGIDNGREDYQDSNYRTLRHHLRFFHRWGQGVTAEILGRS